MRQRQIAEQLVLRAESRPMTPNVLTGVRELPGGGIGQVRLEKRVELRATVAIAHGR